VTPHVGESETHGELDWLTPVRGDNWPELGCPRGDGEQGSAIAHELWLRKGLRATRVVPPETRRRGDGFNKSACPCLGVRGMCKANLARHSSAAWGTICAPIDRSSKVEASDCSDWKSTGH